MHPYLGKCLIRDDFLSWSSSLFGEMFHQRWFFTAEFIPVRGNVSAEMIFCLRVHPYSRKCFCRDDFLLRSSSLFEEMLLQRWFSAAEFILIRGNVSAEMIFCLRVHPYSRKCFTRDDFLPWSSSLFEEMFLQRWFSAAEFIPIRGNVSPEMIFCREVHPCSRKCFCRDDFPPRSSSLFEEIFHQGWFSAAKFIFIRGNVSPRMIFTSWIVSTFVSASAPQRLLYYHNRSASNLLIATKKP